MGAETAYHGEKGAYFAALATEHACNAHTDRPAMLGLAGDVTGLRVLDPGCRAGHYAAELLKLGAAEVVGVEGSETPLGAARERLGDGATSTITYRRMTLEWFLSELLGAGFVLERLVEPRATGGARLVDPRRYDKTHSQPSFLAVRLRRG